MVEYRWTRACQGHAVLEQLFFLNGEVTNRELPGSDAQCYCHSVFPKQVSLPYEINYLMS